MKSVTTWSLSQQIELQSCKMKINRFHSTAPHCGKNHVTMHTMILKAWYLTSDFLVAVFLQTIAANIWNVNFHNSNNLENNKLVRPELSVYSIQAWLHNGFPIFNMKTILFCPHLNNILQQIFWPKIYSERWGEVGNSKTSVILHSTFYYLSALRPSS